MHKKTMPKDRLERFRKVQLFLNKGTFELVLMGKQLRV